MAPSEVEDYRVQDEDPENHAAVQLRGLPYRATSEDIRSFLGSFEKHLAQPVSVVAAGEGAQPGQPFQPIHLFIGRDSRPSGFARVQFDSPEVARSAVADLNRGHLFDRYIEVFIYSERPGKGRSDRSVGRRGEEVPPMGLEAASANLTEADAAGVTRDDVVRELRKEMSDPKKQRMLLSMLGVELSKGSRAYLKQTDQGLKHFLAQYPTEFSIEGGKGSEYVTYTPVLQLSERLELPASPPKTLSGTTGLAEGSSVDPMALFGGADYSNAFMGNFNLDFCTNMAAWGSTAPAMGAAAGSSGSALGAPADPQPAVPDYTGLSSAFDIDAHLPKSPGGHGTKTPKADLGKTPFLKTPSIYSPWPENAKVPFDTLSSLSQSVQQPQASQQPTAQAQLQQLQQLQQQSATIQQMAAAQAAVGNPGWGMSGMQYWPGWPLAGQGFPASGTDGSAAAAVQATAAAAAQAAMLALTQHQAEQQAQQAFLASTEAAATATAAPEAPAASAEPMPIRLRGLPFDASEQDILAFFSQHDVVQYISDCDKAVTINKRPNGRPSGLAVVIMRDREAAIYAQTKLHKQDMGNRYIEILLMDELEDNGFGGGKGGAPGGVGAQAAPASDPASDATATRQQVAPPQPMSLQQGLQHQLPPSWLNPPWGTAPGALLSDAPAMDVSWDAIMQQYPMAGFNAAGGDAAAAAVAPSF